MRIAALASSLLFASVVAVAQTGTTPAETIELKDGGRIVISQDRTMAHYDAAGNRVKMRDNVVMVTKDGSRILMKNNAIWKEITTYGTLRPAK